MKRIRIWLVLIALGAAHGSWLSATNTSAPNPYESDLEPVATNAIDQAVFTRLGALGLTPARLCPDAAFLRRLYVDVLGTVPTAGEARAFLADAATDKRRAAIDRVLERPEFADYWAMKWCDVLRVKAEFPINLWPNGVQAYHRWIRASLRDNLPYDRFARALLTSSGSNFRVPPVNFYRATQNRDPRGLAQTVAQTFMGLRAAGGSSEAIEGMVSCFAALAFKSTGEWKEEIVYFDPNRWTNSAAPSAIMPDGTRLEWPPQRDPREAFADWLIRPENPWFARALVNRVWCWLLGRGIIDEPDDIRPDNPPSNPELLVVLERVLIESHFDLKSLYRAILNSQTYQLSCVPRCDPEAGVRQFAFHPIRRLEAEVLIDAVGAVTGSSDSYSSPVPEPFSQWPEGQRAIALADGSTSSAALDLLGRPPRDTGLISERNNRTTAAQRLHFLNSTHIQRKLDRSALIQTAAQPRRSDSDAVDTLYLSILSRWPTPDERAVVRAHLGRDGVERREAVLDVAWALINTAEFWHRH